MLPVPITTGDGSITESLLGGKEVVLLFRIGTCLFFFMQNLIYLSSFRQVIEYGIARLNFEEKYSTKLCTVFSGILRYGNTILCFLHRNVLFPKAKSQVLKSIALLEPKMPQNSNLTAITKIASLKRKIQVIATSLTLPKFIDLELS